MLPLDLIYLTEPNVTSLVDGKCGREKVFVCVCLLFTYFLTGIERALGNLKHGNVVCPYECNLRIKSMYNWQNVALRTEKVYNCVATESALSSGHQLKRYTGLLCFKVRLAVMLGQENVFNNVITDSALISIHQLKKFFF